MKTLAEFNRTMDAYAMAIKSGYGSIYQYADLIANNTEACWDLVQMIRFNDCQSFYCAWHDLKRSGDDCSPDELMEALAYRIVETALNNHPTLCHE